MKIKNNKFIYLHLFIYVLIFSCNSSSSGQLDYLKAEDQIVAHLQIEAATQVKFTHVFDSIYYVPMSWDEKTPLLSEVYKIKTFGNIIGLFDDLNNSVHMIDFNGQLVNSFYSDGSEGPGKVLDIEDFEIHNDTLFLYERSKQLIHRYNIFTGEYYEGIPFETYFVEMKLFGKNAYLYADDNNFPLDHPMRGKVQIYTNDFKTNILSKLPYIIGRDDFDTPQRFFASINQLFFTDLYNDTIYTIEDDRFYSTYVVDFGKRKIPEQLLKTNDQQQITEEFFKHEYRGFKHYLMANKQWLSFWYRQGMKQNFIFFDRMQGRHINATELLDDYDRGTLPFPIYLDDEKKLFLTVVPKEQIDQEQKFETAKSNLKQVYDKETLNYLVCYIKF